MNLNPTSVSQALVIVGAKLGLDPVDDRVEVLEYLNRIRSLQYHNFHRIRLFDDWLECVPVQQLCMECIDCTCAEYYGFSLSPHLAGPVAAWAESTPMNLRSRWREKFTGRWASAAGLNLVEMPGEFPVSRDIIGQFKIRVRGGSCDDGKTVVIKALDCEGQSKTLCFEIDGDGWVEVDEWVVAIKSVVMPAHTNEIEIAGEKSDGTIETIDTHQSFDPLVPSFRRFKVKSPCNGVCSVYVQASRRFRELVHDEDVVEIGDRLVLEHGASYFKNGEDTIETKEIQRAERDLAMMLDLIRGMVARERGDSDRDGAVPIRGRRTRRAKLPGYRGRR